MAGRKSAITSCRLWKPLLIRDSLKCNKHTVKIGTNLGRNHSENLTRPGFARSTEGGSTRLPRDPANPRSYQTNDVLYICIQIQYGYTSVIVLLIVSPPTSQTNWSTESDH